MLVYGLTLSEIEGFKNNGTIKIDEMSVALKNHINFKLKDVDRQGGSANFWSAFCQGSLLIESPGFAHF